VRSTSPQPAPAPTTDGLPVTSPRHPWPLCRKLLGWFDENQAARDNGQDTGPCSKAELARLLDKSPTTVSNWFEPNCCTPRADVIAKLERCIRVPTSYLMNPDLPWPPRAGLDGARLSASMSDFSQEELDALSILRENPAAMRELMRMVRKIKRGKR